MKRWLKISFLIAAAAFLVFKMKQRFTMPELPLAKTRIKKADGSFIFPDKLPQKYLLISCFQSWCGDCIREAPSIAALREYAGEDKLQVLFISDEDTAKIRQFAGRLNSTIPVYQSEKTFDELGIGVYPSTWLLDENRNILLAKLEGYDWNSPEVRQLIR